MNFDEVCSTHKSILVSPILNIKNGKRGLTSEDRPQTPRDRDGAGNIALGGRVRVRDAGALEEEEREEGEDFSGDAGVCVQGVDAKGFEARYDDEDGRPAVVEAEGQVDEDYMSMFTCGEEDIASELMNGVMTAEVLL